MDKFISRTKKLIFTKQGGIISSTLILSGMILLSRFMGFFRYRVLTDYFNKYELDVFFAAFRIPDLIFEILITGALTSTLIPLFIKYQNDSEELELNLSSIINLISIALGCLIVILFIFMPGITRLALKKGISAIRAYEFELSRLLLQTLTGIPGLQLYGPADPRKLDGRVPTFAFTLAGKHPRAVAEALAKENIYVWDGNYYALAITERLGVEASGGMVRVGAAHYNTLEEIERLGDVLRKIAG